MDIKIRKARASDWPAMKVLSEQSSKYNIELIKKLGNGPAFFEHSLTKGGFSKSLKKKNEVYIIVFDGASAIGFASVRVVPKGRNEKKTVGFLSEIFLIKKYRGKGVAEKVWQELLVWFKTKKVSFLQLNVIINNKHAVNVYKEWGFKPFDMVMSRKF